MLILSTLGVSHVMHSINVRYLLTYLLTSVIFSVICLTVASLTRRALGGAHVPPTKVFRRLTASVNETIVKPRVTAAVGRKTILKPRLAAATYTNTSDFPRCKIPHSMAYYSGESNPVLASGL